MRQEKQMKNKINSIEIKNFKSIKNVNFDCKRINLFVGRPNTGKSNLLEAISLYGACYATLGNFPFMSDFIRYENFNDLFYDHLVTEDIIIKSNIGTAALRYHYNYNYYDMVVTEDKNILKEIPLGGHFNDIEKIIREKNLKKKEDIYSLSTVYFHINRSAMTNARTDLSVAYSPVKKYEFKEQQKFESRFHHFLLPAYGANLYTIAEKNKIIYNYIVKLFKQNKYKFLLKPEETKFDVQKQIRGRAKSFSYSTQADTIQRMIFYYAALFSNKDSILLFEEPEIHAFPPYVSDLAHLIIERIENQYFIVTHSPFLLNTIIENASVKDVAIFKVDYENYKTQVKEFSEKEVSHMLNYGIDIFSKIK